MFGPYRTASILALTCCALMAAACGASNDDADSGDGIVPPGSTLASLSFDPQGTITVEPGGVRALRVLAKPAGVYRLSFALTDTALNASLDRSTALTDENGEAEVLVTAATEVTTFYVRAALGDVTAQVAVNVSGKGFATLEVVPAYAGRRFISYWTASADTGTSCGELVGTPPPDGRHVASSAATAVPTLPDLEVGRRWVVTLRAGHYIGGCAEVDGLMRNTVHRVTVPVVDRPIQLDQTDLGLTLATEPDAKAMGDAVRQHISDATAAMLGDSSSDVDALLDAMNEATTSATGEQAFAVARASGDWDAVLRTVLGESADTSLRDRVRTWMLAGTETLAGPALFTGRIIADGAGKDQVLLDLHTVAGLPAASVGFEPQNPASWTADPADKVVLTSAISWKPALLLAELASAAALVDIPDAVSVADALGRELSCAEIGAELAAASPTAPQSYAGCNADCTAWLCQAALTRIWQRVELGPGPLASFTLTATGMASVDDEARPAGFTGSWVGTLTTDRVGISLAGSASAAAPESAEP